MVKLRPKRMIWMYHPSSVKKNLTTNLYITPPFCINYREVFKFIWFDFYATMYSTKALSLSVEVGITVSKLGVLRFVYMREMTKEDFSKENNHGRISPDRDIITCNRVQGMKTTTKTLIKAAEIKSDFSKSRNMYPGYSKNSSCLLNDGNKSPRIFYMTRNSIQQNGRGKNICPLWWLTFSQLNWIIPVS